MEIRESPYDYNDIVQQAKNRLKHHTNIRELMSDRTNLQKQRASENIILKRSIQSNIEEVDEDDVSVGYRPYDNKPTYKVADTPKTPTEITDLLYLQNVKDVNPYLATLNQLYNSEKNWKDRKRIEQICYAGIGRSVVEIKKSPTPPYSRVNLLIREFMMDVMVEKIEKLRQEDPQTVYIGCCTHSLGFKTVMESDKLKSCLTAQQYRQAILEINRVIQKNFLNYKKRKEPTISFYNKWSLVCCGIGSAFLIVHLFVTMLTILLILCWVFIGIGILLSILGVFLGHLTTYQTVSIIQVIQREIDEECQKISKRHPQTRWSCGTDFYWLEVRTSQNDQNGFYTEQKIVKG